MPVAALAGALAIGALSSAPMPQAASWGTRILARDGSLLALAPAPGGTWRFRTETPAIAPFLPRLLVAVEDRHFDAEPGIDPSAILRAALQWARAGHAVSGGSTLTMQLAKLLDPQPRRLAAKVLETGRALSLWWRLPRQDTLGLYLSLAPYGGNLVGVEAASWAYFGKPPGALDAAEAALLVALPRRPEALRPDRHPQAAQASRDRILRLAQARGLLSAQETDAALAEPVPTRRRPMPRSAPQLLAGVHAPPALATTLDAGLQAALAQAATGILAGLPPRVSMAVMVTDLADGRVSAAWAGDWGNPARAGGLDLTRALRSPGSALKPVLYGLAFADGLAHPDTLLADTPTRYGGYGPEDFSGRFEGRVTAADALRRSLNLPAVGLLARYGALRFTAGLAAAGQPLRLPRGATPSLPVILGGGGQTLRGLMALYGALATDGRTLPPTLRAGTAPDRRPLLPPATAATVAAILTRAFPNDATSRGIAWKTGTSWGDRDNWALGFDRAHLVGVWIGRPDGTAMAGGEAAEVALPVLGRIFGLLPAAPRAAPPAARMATLATAPAADPLRLLFPRPGAVISGDGPLTLRAMGGQRPLSFLVDGAPLPSIPALRETDWTPPGPGFYRLTVLDAAGTATQAHIRVTSRDTALAP